MLRFRANAPALIFASAVALGSVAVALPVPQNVYTQDIDHSIKPGDDFYRYANGGHAPGQYRSDTVRNVEDWYKAYQVTPVDKLYLKTEDRVAIW
jgi:predicted metalloendopeptidase